MNHTLNGAHTQGGMSYDELRRGRLAAMEHPEPLDPDDERELIESDPSIWQALDKLPCERKSGCTPEAACPNCLDRWRFLGMRWHEHKFGPLVHPSDAGRQSEHPGWERPILRDTLPPVPPFPLDIFPAILRDLPVYGGKALNCPPDHFALPMLAIAGGCIGNSRWASITRTHSQSACLYACIVAQKGDAKTPALEMVKAPAMRAQLRMKRNWELAYAAWEKAEEDERGPAPTMQRAIVGDTTTESLSIILDQNPRGVVLVRDELAGMMASMNQYKSGGGHDRQFWLEVWSHSLSPRDRKSDKGPPVFPRRPFTGIIGGTQPEVVARFAGDKRKGEEDDGFLDRWLFAFPEPLKAKGETWLEVPRETLDAWGKCVEWLLRLEMGQDQDGDPCPIFLPLDADARREWEAYTNQLADEMNSPDFPEALRGFWAKAKGYGARLALIIQLLHAACDEGAHDRIEGRSIVHSVNCVTYLKENVKKVYAVMGEDEEVRNLRRLVKWIKANGHRRFTQRDAHRGLRVNGESGKEALEALLQVGISNYFFRPVPKGEGHNLGRKPSPTYDVNPYLF